MKIFDKSMYSDDIKIIIWGTGNFGKSFFETALSDGIPIANLYFCNSSNVNENYLDNFLTTEKVFEIAKKEQLLIVIAIKNLKIIDEIEKKLISHDIANFCKYIPFSNKKNHVDFEHYGTIFMLHRVSDWEDGKLFSNENMKIKPESLDLFLTYLKSKQIDFVALKDLKAYLNSYTGKKGYVVFTMDDGYKDNLYEALPIFKKHNVPFTIFITSNFPDRKAVLWWYILEDLIHSNERIKLSNDITYSCRTIEEKEKAFLEIRSEILKLNQQNIVIELDKLFSNYSINWFEKNDALCLSWDEINMLKSESLVTIASHTEHHYNLKQLSSSDDVKKEIQIGYDRILNITGIESNVFAYPFGSQNEVGDREIAVTRELSELQCACLAYGGKLYTANSESMYSLPRVMLTEEIIANSLKQNFIDSVKVLYKKSFGSKINVCPISSKFGFDRGTPIDRYYIEKFLTENSNYIKGNLLEIADPNYSKKYATGSKNIFNVLTFDNPPEDCSVIVGDLSKPETLPNNVMDCFICTQTYNFIYDVKKAIESSYKMLKKDGVLLATVSGISQISRYDMDYWRFTDLSIRKFLMEFFDEDKISIKVYGNSIAASAFLQGISIEDFDNQKILEEIDMNYQLIIGIVAKK